jgi:hypothetical protein
MKNYCLIIFLLFMMTPTYAAVKIEQYVECFVNDSRISIDMKKEGHLSAAAEFEGVADAWHKAGVLIYGSDLFEKVQSQLSARVLAFNFDQLFSKRADCLALMSEVSNIIKSKF